MSTGGTNGIRTSVIALTSTNASMTFLKSLTLSFSMILGFASHCPGACVRQRQFAVPVAPTLGVEREWRRTCTL